MRTSLTSRGRRRLVAVLAAAALPLGIVAATGGTAFAHAAPGSPIEVVTNTSASGGVADAIQNGWWGHEGGANNGTGTLTTFLDLNLSDSNLASTFPDLSKVGVAFVPTSADGSAEKPAATTGQRVDQVFPYFMDAGVETGLNGNTNANDSVITVSTPSEYNAWFSAGQPLQGYNNSLQLLDVSAPGQPVSSTPQGKSILNRWPAGTNMSLVFYRTTGATSPVNGLPIVDVSSGHAVTAYMPFTTVAKPGDTTLRTSAGYINTAFGAVAVNTHSVLTTNVASPQPAGTAINLTATVTADTGTNTPAGSVEFFDGGTSLGTATLNASGVATKTGVTLPVGTHANLHTVYTPANTAAAAFNASTSPDVSFTINGIATTTAAAATTNGDVTHAVDLTATVTPGPSGATGTVVFKDGGVSIGSDNITAADNVANLSHTFTTPGSHTVTAFFTPDAASANYSASQGAVTFNLDPPSGVSTDTQSVTATIPPGTITVTTPYTAANPLDLGTVNLNSALTGYLGSATFKDIHVFDTRSGAQSWTLTALAGNLSDGAATPHFINGQNLGLTALAPETTNILGNPVVNNPGLGTITATNWPVPASPVAPGDGGSLGLGGTAKTILAANQGPSDAWYSGTLTLFAPTTTTTGLYTGTITFTAS